MEPEHILDIRTANRHELEARRNQLQQEKKSIEAVIQNYKVTEQRATETGDGFTAVAARKTVATQQELLERLVIEESAIMKRLQEYEKNKADAEKLKPEIEQLYNQTASKHVNRIIKAQNVIVESLKEIAVINGSIEGLAGQYLALCGEKLYAPTIAVPGILRQFARVTTALGPEGTTVSLQPVEPFAYRKEREESNQ
jgi:hypothetical protein